MEKSVKEHFQIIQCEPCRERFSRFAHQVVSILHQFINNCDFLFHCFFSSLFVVFIISY